MTNSSPWYGWPIEIDGLPSYKMGGSFHGYVSHNQRVIANQMLPSLDMMLRRGINSSGNHQPHKISSEAVNFQVPNWCLPLPPYFFQMKHVSHLGSSNISRGGTVDTLENSHGVFLTFHGFYGLSPIFLAGDTFDYHLPDFSFTIFGDV